MEPVSASAAAALTLTADVVASIVQKHPHLKSLNLSGNGISSLDPACLAPLTGLTRLDLGHNSLTHLGGLSPLHNLKELAVPGNQM